MTRLFHVSDQAGIEIFHPRPVPNPSEKFNGEAVWAVDETHLPNYLLPRDCPRVTYAAGPATSEEDQDLYLAGHSRVVALEEAWRPAVEVAELYLYELPTTEFLLIDAGAGYYVSRTPVIPIACTKLKNPLLLLAEKKVDVRFFDSLQAVRAEVVVSTLEFSVIRWRNAKP